jgi:chemotaxis response regulator CheB
MTPELLKLWWSVFPNDELRPAIARTRADVLVLDLETSRTDDIGRLRREFPTLCIVGTHRLANDQLWAQALDQGACDLCEPRDYEVVRSVLHEWAQHAA